MRSLLLTLALGLSTALSAQTAPPPVATAPAPATKLEAFEPNAGAIYTMGYDVVGSISKFATGSLSVQAREMSTGPGTAVRGLIVGTAESQFRSETTFVDVDEIEELIAALAVIVAIKSNPTSFANFERSYRTRGELVVGAYSSVEGIRLQIRTGRVLRASVSSLTTNDMAKVRAMLVAGHTKLKTAVGGG